MPRWTALTIASLALVGVAVAVLTRVGSRRWSGFTDQQERTLLALSETSAGRRRVDFRDFEQNPPAPVAKYVRLALRDGQHVVQVARFRGARLLVHRPPRATGGCARRAKPARLYPSASSGMPGFVWHPRSMFACTTPTSTVRVWVRRACSRSSPCEDRGTPELNAGELYRFLDLKTGREPESGYSKWWPLGRSCRVSARPVYVRQRGFHRLSLQHPLGRPAGGTVRQAAAPSLPPDFSCAIDGQFTSLPYWGPCAMAIDQKAPVIVSDISQDARWDNFEWCRLALAVGLRRSAGAEKANSALDTGAEKYRCDTQALCVAEG